MAHPTHPHHGAPGRHDDAPHPQHGAPDRHDHHAHDGQHSHGHGGAGDDPAGFAELLDLDGELLREHLSELTARLAALAGSSPVRRILDLGCGTGTGTFALLRRFPDAEAVAVDGSPELLHHLQRRAEELGLAERVRTVRADLDTGWPGLAAADLVWASASLHHLGDADRTLGEAAAALRPGGLLAVVEPDGVPYFLPEDVGLGRPGLEARCRAASAGLRAGGFPHLGADWGARLSRAGLTIEDKQVFDLELRSPLPPAAGRYARVVLQRLRAALDTTADPADLAALDALIDGDAGVGVLHRSDLVVRTERTLWV
ncbi:class I SAM-dependent methyltransferase, partial [Kitasatospora sp. NPDC059571]|uniref:class I SAM-dependent methyltransferase n=1 Tax=Kitasatospora sp. NPDC059571 TaxID=3346871 RepID=UPI0036C8F055